MDTNTMLDIIKLIEARKKSALRDFISEYDMTIPEHTKGYISGLNDIQDFLQLWVEEKLNSFETTMGQGE